MLLSIYSIFSAKNLHKTIKKWFWFSYYIIIPSKTIIGMGDNPNVSLRIKRLGISQCSIVKMLWVFTQTWAPFWILWHRWIQDLWWQEWYAEFVISWSANVILTMRLSAYYCTLPKYSCQFYITKWQNWCANRSNFLTKQPSIKTTHPRAERLL